MMKEQSGQAQDLTQALSAVGLSECQNSKGEKSLLKRLLPVPSDRMGYLWGILALRDSYVLEYGPTGTTHYGISALGLMDLEVGRRYTVTHLSEKDVVMGDMSRLERAVREIAQQEKPEHLFIVGSSVTATIGSDLEGVAFYLQDEVESHMHVYDTGGFRGHYLQGFKACYEILAACVLADESEALAASREARATDAAVKAQEGWYYNILGAMPDHYRLQSDLAEIERMMARSFGAQKGCTFLVQGALADLKAERIGRARVNLVLRKEALPLAKALAEKYQQPYVFFSPYGYEGTLEALEQVGEATGEEIDAAYRAELLQKAASRARYFRSWGLDPAQLCVRCVGYQELNDGLAKMLGELGLTLDQAVLAYADEKERLALLACAKPLWLLGDSQLLARLQPGQKGDTLSFPWQTAPFATHLPFVGERGMDWFCERLEMYIRDLSRGLRLR